MKKSTWIGMSFILVCFLALILYVKASPDFVAPSTARMLNSDTKSWDKTMDDLLNYLNDLGLIDFSTQASMTDGVGTEATYISGAEFYWWDVENLEEGSPEKTAFDEAYEEGVIDLWGMGQFYMPVIVNGPFAVNLANYEGDVSALEKAFEAFGREG